MRLIPFNSVKSLLLNADVVTMFDPVSSEQLKSITMNCTNCAEKLVSMQSESIDKSHLLEEMSSSVNETNTLVQTEEYMTESMEIDQRTDTRSCSAEPPLHED